MSNPSQFSLEDQYQLRQTIETVARKRVAPRAAEIDARAEYPQDMFDLLKDMGLFALPFPAEYGGTGSTVAACIAVEELGRFCYNTGYLLVAQWVPFGAILYGGRDDQKARYLPGLARGDLRAAVSVTEPGGGSDVANITTRAEKRPGGYALTGTKIWCTNSSVADFILVAAKTGAGRGHNNIGLFIVEKGTPGLLIARHEDKLGARGLPSCELRFDEAFIPDENVLGGEPAKGFKLVMEAFNRSRPIIGARGVGLARGALELATRFVKERQAFGQAVAEFQGIQWMLADMQMQTEAAKLLVYKAAQMVDDGVSGKALAPWAAMSKCFATDVAMKVATDAVQLFGSAGISRDNPIERYFRDAKVTQIIEGTNQIQRNIIGRYVIDALA
ncbi:MAG TPA: acyl-CoA dehydrogenase family protein [Rhodocyclaceae bacterium]|nr:acyl-CoA dehydrogenase family protein [Rhodocyclaceae bacterium]